MKIDIPDLKLETDEVCTVCWSSGIVDRQYPTICKRCTNCNNGYVKQITPFGEEILAFIKKYLRINVLGS